MEAISIDSSTLFPPLLMSMVGKWDLQSQLWKRIARIDLSTYLSVLKYRSDLSDESRNQPEKASARFLEELIDGVELPLNAYFQPLRRAVLEEIVGERNVRELAVKGRLSVGAAAVGFSFLPRPPSKPSVLIDEPEGRILRFFNLSPSGYRLDSGRLIGMGLVKDGLKAAIEKRHLAGGERWISHLVQGQLRFLFQEAETIPNRDELEITLSHYRGKIVPQRGDKMFSIDALLENLRSCNPGEVFGPARAPMDEGRDALKALFDKHYADALLIYRELVEKNVPALASQFGFFSALPLRFEVIITSQYWHISRWRPVASWDRVGADVEFRDSAPDLRLDAESWFASAAAELQALKRPAKFSHMWTAGMMPDWDGHDHLGNFDGETSSLRQACEWFARDMDAQLRTVPSSDHV
jgi:hypothetical protein